MTRGHRRLPFGAELVPGGARFRLYAPALRSITLDLRGTGRIPLARSDDGYFEATVAEATTGSRYRYELAPGEWVPDPASRFQPDGVFGESEVIDPLAYEWSAKAWPGRPWHEAVVYELHVGCFDPKGTFGGVRRRLDHLVRLGITAVELMPVAAFAGSRNWGYDAVLPYAPHSAYGRPEDLKRLVDACHERGLMVLADVVYNHFGPSGNFLGRYAPDFFHADVETPWGAALAFENPALRLFFIENALYWLEEFAVDGLRLDAVHAIEEVAGGADFLRELVRRVRAEAGARDVHLVLENDRNEAHWLPERKPPPLYTAQWNDDFHHAAHVAATGEMDGYYADYAGEPVRHLARSLAEGFAYQGEPSGFRDGRRRGQPSARLWPGAFVNFLQNHDQVGNRAFGERLSRLVGRERMRALSALQLLAPPVPLLFMGEEWAAESPFLYFCDLPGALADAVREGRRSEFRRFAAFRDPAALGRIPDPGAAETYRASQLDWDEVRATEHADWLEFVGGLLECRRRELLPRLPELRSGHYRLFAARGFEIAWPASTGATWLVTANLGEEAATGPPPRGRSIYTAPGAVSETLPPWSVRVTLDE